jgi:hypothetical protein
MTKISKTAAASMKGGPEQKKADPFDTNAKKIRELQIQRQNHLAVARYDFIDALLEEYGKLQESFARLEKQSKIDVEIMGQIDEARDKIVAERDKLKGDVALLVADRDSLRLELQAERTPPPSRPPSPSEQLQDQLEPIL